MTADELRRLAVLIERTDYDAIDRAAAYLRACAEAMDAGPVAWAATDETGKIVEALGMNGTRRFSDPLYLRALPAQVQALRIPEPMTPNDINLAARAELAGLLDHIYEYGTMSEGVMPLAVTFARAIDTVVLRRVKEANK